MKNKEYEEYLINNITDRQNAIIERYKNQGAIALNVKEIERCKRELIEDSIIVVLQKELTNLKIYSVEPILIKVEKSE